MSEEFTSTGTLTFQCTLCGKEHPYIDGVGINLCPDRDRFLTTEVPAAFDARSASSKLISYLETENSVLHEKVRRLEIKLAAEREACAKVAEEWGYQMEREAFDKGSDAEMDAQIHAAKSIAALIRGRT